MTEDPLAPIRRLQEQVDEKTQGLGLKMVAFAVLPGVPDHCQVVFEIDASEVGKEPSEREIDRETEKFRAEIAAADREKRQQEAIEGLRKRAEGGGGFLG